jgi:hypothetical protein
MTIRNAEPDCHDLHRVIESLGFPPIGASSTPRGNKPAPTAWGALKNRGCTERSAGAMRLPRRKKPRLATTVLGTTCLDGHCEKPPRGGGVVMMQSRGHCGTKSGYPEVLQPAACSMLRLVRSNGIPKRVIGVPQTGACTNARRWACGGAASLVPAFAGQGRRRGEENPPPWAEHLSHPLAV